MKTIFYSLMTALSMYSVLPVPRVEWNRDNMRYVMCFFPLVGVMVGAAQLLWYTISVHFGIVAGLYAALAALIPLLISGGIHMDGFMDTADAISSHALMERKLEILKDSHVGAFGALFCAGYLLLSYGLWQQLYHRPQLLLPLALSYVVSRCCSALSVATFPPAKSSGLVHTFADSAAKNEVVVTNLVILAVVFGICAWISLLCAAVFVAIVVVYFLFHRRFCLWEFGGNTGDLAGFLLQNMELLLLIAAVIGGIVA